MSLGPNRPPAPRVRALVRQSSPPGRHRSNPRTARPAGGGHEREPGARMPHAGCRARLALSPQGPASRRRPAPANPPIPANVSERFSCIRARLADDVCGHRWPLPKNGSIDAARELWRKTVLFSSERKRTSPAHPALRRDGCDLV